MKFAVVLQQRKILKETPVGKTILLKDSENKRHDDNTTKRYNTIFRLINILFSPDYIPQFLMTNKEQISL
jgi:hypothetical protein